MNSFLQGRKAIASLPLRGVVSASLPAASAPGTAARPPSNSTPACANGAPTIEVVKEGDKVVRLVVVCTCGERVEIECLYPAGS